MILSASGWRKVFAQSGRDEDNTPEIGETNRLLSALIGETFSEYIKNKTGRKNPRVVVAQDTRPTGAQIADSIIRALACCGIQTVFTGYAAAPEVMAYAKSFDGFVYISASHNPIGHNGIKFGLNDGGVLPGPEAKNVIESFKAKCASPDSEEHARSLIEKADKATVESIYGSMEEFKKESVAAYDSFIRHVICGSGDKTEQDRIFDALRESAEKNPLTIVCDMNGSARSVSIDKTFIPEKGFGYVHFNSQPGQIVHAIIPEPENLVHCAREMESQQKNGNKAAVLGYMPDCDGDRGNIVYWNYSEKKAKPIAAQEVFALCVLAELSFEYWKNPDAKKLAVAVNCPTSMRIDEICRSFKASLFRAEVGEANVVNLAREKRNEGYNVRIFGEGSNGGNITYPSAVRDPVATVFALVKLLSIRDTKDSRGLFHIWCTMSGQENCYRDDFTLEDVINTLPAYTTTGVSESRAILDVKTQDKGELKARFKNEFERAWEGKKDMLKAELGIDSYDCCITNGTKETVGADNWNNGNGGLKVRFLDESHNPVAFIWMRPSGTEPVFRVMCDIKGERRKAEEELLSWECEILRKADGQ